MRKIHCVTYQYLALMLALQKKWAEKVVAFEKARTGKGE